MLSWWEQRLSRARLAIKMLFLPLSLALFGPSQTRDEYSSAITLRKLEENKTSIVGKFLNCHVRLLSHSPKWVILKLNCFHAEF